MEGEDEGRSGQGSVKVIYLSAFSPCIDGNDLS